MKLEQRRALTYTALLVLLAAGASLAVPRDGWANGQVHEALEVLATATALFLGVLALVRFYSKKNNIFLFLGTGFLATAFMDGYHAVFTGSSIAALLGIDAPPSMIAATSLNLWSWLASRTLLALFFCLNWLGWRRERAMGQAGRVRERLVYLTTGMLAVATIAMLELREVPPLHDPEAPIPVPLELVPALLYLLALVGYLAKAHWKDNAFDHWLVVSLVLGFAADGFYMAFSQRLYDASFDVAHLLKVASYGAVGVGLLISVYRTFRQAEESAEALALEVVERERARKAAEEATKAKSQFLAHMSHELRTPLNSIIGFANLLRKNKHGRMAEGDLLFLERIRESGLHLLSLINEVLDLSKVEAGRMEVELQTVSLDGLVTETVEQFRGQVVDRDVALEARVPPRLAPLVTDRGKLKQVLINLVGNAIKFTPRGTVRIQVQMDPETRIPIRIDVTDTGIGIPAGKRDAIFEAFRQADSGMARNYGGTGLGLTISRSLCRLMGYDLAVQSEEGVGSTFSVLLNGTDGSGPDLAPSPADRTIQETPPSAGS